MKAFFQSLTGRLLAAAVIWSAIAMGVGGWLLSGAFRTYVLADVDARLEAQIDSMVGVSEIAPDGVLRFTRPLFDQRFTTPYSGYYWQVSEMGQSSFRSRSLWDFELEPDLSDPSFDLAFHEHLGPDDQTLRVAERDIILPEADRVFRYQAAQDVAAVQDAIERFNDLLTYALALITGTLTLALMIQVVYGLRPLRDIRRQLQDVRAGKAKEIGSDFPPDLSPLANEIDALIHQNTKLVDRARTQVGNLAHALKTPLSVIQNEVEGGETDRTALVKKQADDIRGHIDHYLKRAQIAGGASGVTTPVYQRLDKIARAIERLYSSRGLDIAVNCTANVLFAGDRRDLDELLGNLIENAGKWAKTKASVTVMAIPDSPIQPMMQIVIEDDGPGVPDATERATLFERGKRLDERVPGTGLGLNIVRDIVDLYGGIARLDEAKLGGLQVTVTLPMKLAD